MRQLTNACLVLVAAQCLFAATAQAQQPAVRHYDIPDGLGHSLVGAIYQDRKGYIWFGTADGLSRFDGYNFITYGIDDGLGSLIVNSITEDRQGQLWVATTAGIARLIDDPKDAPALRQGEMSVAKRKKFVSYRVGNTRESNGIGHILFDQEGTLWCTSDEIYRASVAQGGDLTFDVAITLQGGWTTLRAFSDSRGRLWFGLNRELIEVVNGEVIRYGTADGLPLELTLNKATQLFDERITSIAEDRACRVFVSNPREVFEFVEPTTGDHSRGRWKKLPLPLPSTYNFALMIGDAHGGLLIGTNKGVIRRTQGGQIERLFQRNIADAGISSLLEDRQGNLWFGVWQQGVYKLANAFILSYTKADGLPGERVYWLIENRDGRIYAVTGSTGVVEIVEGRLVPNPAFQKFPFNAAGRMFYDSRGNYWLPTRTGLFRLPGPKLEFEGGEKFTGEYGARSARESLGTGLYEDLQGRVWCGAYRDPAIYVFDPSQEPQRGFRRIPIASILSAPTERIPDVLQCTIGDPSGALWFGWHNDITRYRDGKIEFVRPTDGLPQTAARAFFIDSRAWLWIALESGGVSMTRNPTAEQPKYVNYSTSNGLVNNTVRSFAEDDLGRMYISTGKGIDRLDPATGAIRHFRMADGVAGTDIGHSLKDRQGNIWVATASGLTRINPRIELGPAHPPPTYFNRIQIAGEELPLPVTGTTRVVGLELPASRNHVLIEFLALSFQGEDALRYQYKLEGVDPNWSEPGQQRSVNYAQLAPRRYKLLVRSVNPEGEANDEPSVFEFLILPPIWQRWWFILLATVALAAAAFALHRMRVRQIVAMEKIRRQVATDLHDDVGSGLAQIAILSEVVKRQSPVTTAEVLGEVADLARSMRDSMSDIVWAVDPHKDRLTDLVQRMRQATYNLLEADGVRVEFHAPEEREIEGVNLAPDRRRQLLLIFKEAITNVARHAGASAVRVNINLESNELYLAIRDDGCGFDARINHNGQGLRSLKRRADELQASLDIESGAGRGTSIEVRVPLK